MLSHTDPDQKFQLYVLYLIKNNIFGAQLLGAQLLGAQLLGAQLLGAQLLGATVGARHKNAFTIDR